MNYKVSRGKNGFSPATFGNGGNFFPKHGMFLRMHSKRVYFNVDTYMTDNCKFTLSKIRNFFEIQCKKLVIRIKRKDLFMMYMCILLDIFYFCACKPRM